MKTNSTMNTSKSTLHVQAAVAVVAAALAGALSIGSAMPALAEEAPDQGQQTTVALDDASADEGAWDATATEDGFSADANTYAPEVDVNQNDLGSTDATGGSNWWWRRVSPWDALQSAERYLGIYDCDNWDYQIGRFRGTPAYRIEIDTNDWQPWGYYWHGAPRYVVFVNYFTGRVMAAYVDYD
jgi:hypothetical protein